MTQASSAFDLPVPQPDAARRRLLAGLACGLGTSLIWGLQAVVSRQSVANGLSAADVTILRFATASLILLPVALARMRPFPVGILGWGRAALLTLLVGAPYSLVLLGGAAFAPALHSSIISPGLIPIFTAIMAYAVAGERPGRQRTIGLALVLAGIAGFSWQALSASQAGPQAWIGDLLFVLNALLWSLFGLLARRWNADAIDVTIVTCLLSLLILPVFAATLPMRLGQVGLMAIAWQAFYQGALVGVGALFLYTRSVALLGASRATLFLPLNPVITAVAGLALLGELPSAVEIAGLALVVVGMAVAFSSRSTANPAEPSS